jgi:serine/threonine-protein kinase
MAADVFRIVGTTVVGAFHVQAVVAEGGFAVVYRAHHEGFRAPVALKCLKIPPHLPPAARERFADQFRREAELLFKLSATITTVVRPLHVESVVAPSGAFMPFLALEWLDGETLETLAESRRAAGKPIGFSELFSLLTPVGRALERAHAFSVDGRKVAVVHRDLKPENIFMARVSGETVVKILDFGISAVLDLARVDAPSANTSIGNQGAFTPAFAAPEQWAPERFGETGPWTDVWSLALTMSEVLCGRSVFDGEREELMRLMTNPESPRTPAALGVAVPPAVERVFAKALAVQPRERFPNAGEFWNALTAASEKPRPSSGGRSFSEFDASDEPRLAIELGDEPVQPPRASTPRPAPPSVEPRAPTVLAVTAPAAPAVAVPKRPMNRWVITAALLGLGVSGGVANWASAAATGEAVTLGPVPLSWVATALVLGGLAMALYRLVSSTSEG